jgi:dienelactone hydrolase
MGRRLLVALLVVLAGAGAGAAVWSHDARPAPSSAGEAPDGGPGLAPVGSPGSAAPVRAPAARTPRPAPAPAAPSGPPPRLAPTGVGIVTLDIYDPTRPTVAQGRVLASSRHLPTVIRYPAVGPRGDQEGAGAAPAPGPWPMVVFAHGYDVTPDTYRHLLHSWAMAGFVVVAPEFPLETAGGPLDENDLMNEPADISAVISAVLSRSATGSGVLSHLVDPGRIAVAGHSDGAVAALGSAFGQRDPRIGPVIAMAGAPSAGIPHPDARHPLLVVQGTADDIDQPVNGWNVYRAAGRPRILLELDGAGHLPPVADPTPWRPIVEAVTIDFLRHYLGLGTTIGTLAADGSHPGITFIGGEA